MHTIEGNAGENDEYVIRDSYDINASNINGYGQNGGIVDDDSEILKEAGRVGIFKDCPILPPGFSQETNIGVISLAPLVTVKAKISYTPTIGDGKVYQVESSSPDEIGASINNDLFK